MSSRTDRSGFLVSAVLVATILVAAVLRVIGLQSGLWYDEIVTLVVSARQPFASIVTDFQFLNVHPLYSVLAHVSISVFGESAWAMRLPACIFGIASVPIAYLLATRMTTRVEALAGAAVLATSYHHIWFSQNARGYTLMGLLALWSTWLLMKGIAEGRTKDFVLYAIVSALGVYTHLTMIFIVVGHALAVVATELLRSRTIRDRRLLPVAIACVGAGVLSAVLYAPFIGGILNQMTSEAPRKAAEVATASWALGEALRSVLAGTGVPAAIAGGLFAGIGGLSLWRKDFFAFSLLTAPAVVTAVGILAMGQPLRPRFFFFLSGAAAIFVGRGIGAVAGVLASARESDQRMTVAVTVLTLALVSASAVALPQNYRWPKQDFESARRFLEHEEAAGARIAVVGPACYPFQAYYEKAWRCLVVVDDWNQFTAAPARSLVSYTLADYIDDPGLRTIVQRDCRPIQRYAGTLGGGDIVVCEAR